MVRAQSEGGACRSGKRAPLSLPRALLLRPEHRDVPLSPAAVVSPPQRARRALLGLLLGGFEPLHALLHAQRELLPDAFEPPHAPPRARRGLLRAEQRLPHALREQPLPGPRELPHGPRHGPRVALRDFLCPLALFWQAEAEAEEEAEEEVVVRLQVVRLQVVRPQVVRPQVVLLGRSPLLPQEQGGSLKAPPRLQRCSLFLLHSLSVCLLRRARPLRLALA